MVTPKRLYNFMVEPDMLEALKRLKRDPPDVSEGHLMRQALREFLEREGVMKRTARPRKRAKRSSPSTRR